jgi:hypothetical protein
MLVTPPISLFATYFLLVLGVDFGNVFIHFESSCDQEKQCQRMPALRNDKDDPLHSFLTT